MSYTSTQEVVRVYQDGGADISFTSSALKMRSADGKDLVGGEVAASQPSTMRVTAVGSPNELDASNAIRISWEGSLREGLAALKKGLKIGESDSFKSVDPPLTNSHTSGKATLVGVKEDVASIRVESVCVHDFDRPEDHEHIEGSYKIRISNGVLLSADFTVKDAAVRGGGIVHALLTLE